MISNRKNIRAARTSVARMATTRIRVMINSEMNAKSMEAMNGTIFQTTLEIEMGIVVEAETVADMSIIDKKDPVEAEQEATREDETIHRIRDIRTIIGQLKKQTQQMNMLNWKPTKSTIQWELKL